MFHILLILKTLKRILNQQEKQMAQIDDLNTAIDTLTADIADVGTNVGDVLTLLKAAQSGGTPVDLTAAIEKLTAADASLKTVDASLKAVEPPVTPPVTPGA